MRWHSKKGIIVLQFHQPTVGDCAKKINTEAIAVAAVPLPPLYTSTTTTTKTKAKTSRTTSTHKQSQGTPQDRRSDGDGNKSQRGQATHLRTSKRCHTSPITQATTNCRSLLPICARTNERNNERSSATAQLWMVDGWKARSMLQRTNERTNERRPENERNPNSNGAKRRRSNKPADDGASTC